MLLVRVGYPFAPSVSRCRRDSGSYALRVAHRVIYLSGAGLKSGNRGGNTSVEILSHAGQCSRFSRQGRKPRLRGGGLWPKVTQVQVMGCREPFSWRGVLGSVPGVSFSCTFCFHFEEPVLVAQVYPDFFFFPLNHSIPGGWEAFPLVLGEMLQSQEIRAVSREKVIE